MNAQDRLVEISAQAKRAEEQGEDGRAAAEWRRYRLIRDSTRDPEDLLTEGVTLSAMALEMIAARP
ncbi:MAG TPA: hypothetical protein VFS64_06255 [Solirubrobacterales bacterium]|nr:hypothetical protein [Solirubrobacterales bacterium]